MNNLNNNKNNEMLLDVPEKNKDLRNIVLSIVGVFVILAIVSGGTFAYYAFTVSNSTTVNGAAATANMTMNATLASASATGTGKMVPQPTAGIKSAIRGKMSTSSGIGNRCIDTNGNTVCKIYKITLKGPDVNFHYKINLKFVFSGTWTNLKWIYLPVASYSATANTSVTYDTVYSATTSDQLVTSGTVSAGATVDHYIVIWIDETGTTQNATDTGSFTGVLTLLDYDTNAAQLTSSFTS